MPLSAKGAGEGAETAQLSGEKKLEELEEMCMRPADLKQCAPRVAVRMRS
jgi:hypothetical protein